MGALPIELWHIIMGHLIPESQKNLKLVCKTLHQQLVFDYDYTEEVKTKYFRYWSKMAVGYDEILEYLVQSHDHNKITLINLADAMIEKRTIRQTNCVHHFMYKCGIQLCEYCKFETECASCSHTGMSNSNDPKSIQIRKCGKCSTLIKVNICSTCNEVRTNCQCVFNIQRLYTYHKI